MKLNEFYQVSWTNRLDEKVTLKYLDEPYLYKITEILINEGKHIVVEKQ